MKALTSYRLSITPLSPIHIGTGESYEPTNYVIDEGVLYEFDTGTVMQVLTRTDRAQLQNITSGTPGPTMVLAVQRFFFDRRALLMSHSVQRIPVLSGVANLYKNRIGQTANLESGGKKVINRLEIDRTGFDSITRLPLLYGSSMKGAMRTALLDRVNAGALTQDKKGLHEFQGGLFRYRDPDKRKLFLEKDPMRLIHVSDAVWSGERDIPAAQVYLAINRKKAPVKDQQGNLRKSQAESRDLYQILECIPGWRYRAFTNQINIQCMTDLDKHYSKNIPAKELRFDITDIAHACNTFYEPILEAENQLMIERGYLDITWEKSTQMLLNSCKERMERGEIFLLRVGRHSGAESVTLNGVRSIRIMLDRDQATKKQRFTSEKAARTFWLAAQELDQTSNLLPFGWLLVEVYPMFAHPNEWKELSDICEPYLTEASAVAVRLKEMQDKLALARAQVDAQRQAEEEKERAELARQMAAAAEKQRKEQEEEARKKIEEERLAKLSPLDRMIEDVVAGRKDPNLKPSIALFNALKEGRWGEEDARKVAGRIKDMMIEEGGWIDNPDPAKAKKDKSVKRVLDIMAFLKE